jgi:hypothetical protein
LPVLPGGRPPWPVPARTEHRARQFGVGKGQRQTHRFGRGRRATTCPRRVHDFRELEKPPSPSRLVAGGRRVGQDGSVAIQQVFAGLAKMEKIAACEVSPTANVDMAPWFRSRPVRQPARALIQVCRGGGEPVAVEREEMRASSRLAHSGRRPCRQVPLTSRSISSVPNPLCFGFFTTGPSLAPGQNQVPRSAAIDFPGDRRPAVPSDAPYLVALVATRGRQPGRAPPSPSTPAAVRPT